MLKAARITAATAVVLAVTLILAFAAMAADDQIPSCGGFGGGSSGGTSGEAPAGGEGGGMMGIMFPLAIFVLIFYFFIIRPQKKRQRQQDDLMSSISRGDQIVTIGGFFGTVQEVRDDSFMIEIAKDVRVKILKTAVSTKRGQTQTQSSAHIEDK
ncbi:MAG: preprotein translocase subunit YajC [Synergistaceae bacterium]|nr:preprotein translocase subunit YajC [Synergistaceae bacterium]